MDYTEYVHRFFTQPPPAPRFAFLGQWGATLYFQDYEAAVSYYQQVLGPPAYVEGEYTKGWRIGETWLTLLRGEQGNPRNVEIQFVLAAPAEAERLQAAFIAAGGTGAAPSDQLMYTPVRLCPVRDPFGVEIMIISQLG